ncbi:hypothetical protein [Lactococcus protaetiae]|uniref:DUF443 family protein n=1 Tax=Lactococcus protaetiae TaxID=2592653 RepID=A0A514Z9X6_9LACT|nr:hypothetical protein [Lactococcus protaetiae]QDK71383.1 hypothetical protein FLP15_09725 [Lactococcus protaetiae]
MDKNKTTIIEGQMYQVSFNSEKAAKGWLLLVSKDEEFLVKQNSFLFRNRFPRKVYQADVNLKKYILEKSRKSRKVSFNWVFVGMPLGTLLYKFMPSGIFFGSFNDSINWLIGILNIILLWLVILFSFLYLAYIRKLFLQQNIKKMGGDLRLFGQFITDIPLGTTKAGIEGTEMRMKIIAYGALSVFIVLPTIVFPFFVQLRLFSIFIVGLVYLVLFNGNYASDGKTATYEIQILERENR